MISGTLEVTVRGEKVTLDSGCVLVIAPGEPHAVHAVTACFVIDVFYPIRTDYRRE